MRNKIMRESISLILFLFSLSFFSFNFLIKMYLACPPFFLCLMMMNVNFSLHKNLWKNVFKIYQKVSAFFLWHKYNDRFFYYFTIWSVVSIFKCLVILNKINLAAEWIDIIFSFQMHKSYHCYKKNIKIDSRLKKKEKYNY